MSQRGTEHEDEEVGMGWGGLVASRSELASERATERLEADARYGRQVRQRLDGLMRSVREDGHVLVYADLVRLWGTS